MNSQKKNALNIFNAAVSHADPNEAVKRVLYIEGKSLYVDKKKYFLETIKNIYLIGAGKAGVPMASAIEEIFGDKLNGGIITVKYGHSGFLKKIKVMEAGHPVPDKYGLMATKKILDFIKPTTKEDMVICVISGGGSALLPLPGEGISLDDKIKITELLLESGATIHEINIVRKHISSIKGGRLAEAVWPSSLITLILSDVIGDDPATIASGPTAPDPSFFGDAFKVLEKYRLIGIAPGSIVSFLKKGIKGETKETPVTGNKIFKKAYSKIIANNSLSIKAAEKKAKELGYNTLIFNEIVHGDTTRAAKDHTDLIKEILNKKHHYSLPLCIISGGETTVKIIGGGKGGRNQEFVLAASIEIEGLKKVTVLSCGTDGTDGPTDAAGAIADGFTVERARKVGKEAVDFLRDNNSYYFFKSINDLIITGPTMTNVMDIRIILVN